MEVTVKITGTLQVEKDDLPRLKRDSPGDVFGAILRQGRPVGIDITENEVTKKRGK